ncbi:MAG: hypothetical protein JWR16_921 [Nevskia sp.]|nr:hypothetical protein [Nevskia sp.]
MPFVYRYLFLALWLSWMLYWWASSRDVKPALWRESLLSRLVHLVPLVLAALLLWLPAVPVPGLNERFLPSTDAAFWIGAAVTAIGLLIAVWARRYLGRNWSGTVTIKVDHELIIGGPYAYVRHPIYSGLLLGFVGTAIARGEWSGVLAVALTTLAFWWKLRLEERGMRSQFGEAYQLYSQRVAALIPFVL